MDEKDDQSRHDQDEEPTKGMPEIDDVPGDGGIEFPDSSDIDDLRAQILSLA